MAVVVGATEVMGRVDAVGRRERGGEIGPGPQLLPAEPVEDQQDDTVGLSGERRDPLGCRVVGARQRGNDVADAGTLVVGHDGGGQIDPSVLWFGHPQRH